MDLNAGPKDGLIRESILEGREDDEGTLFSFFENSRSTPLSKSATSFPSNASAFNDTSGRYSIRSQQQDRLSKSRSLPYCNLESVPAFVHNPKEQVCRFEAFFTEAVPENLAEKTRSRKVDIFYYVEDCTIEVVEPRDANSGLLQGKVLKRHQIVKPKKRNDSLAASLPNQIYKLNDFTSGSQVDFYNTIYTVVDADEPTKKYLDDMGLPFGSALGAPATYMDPKISRSRPAPRVEPLDGTVAALSSKMTGFHKYGRKVLRFFGVWDCRSDLFGDDLRVRVHYMLADDTMEVLPVNSRNSGRDRVQKLLKKTKVMMPYAGVDASSLSSSWDGGGWSKEEMSPPSSPSSASGSYSPSATSRSSPAIAVSRPYHWTDLHIGDRIPVAAMTILLVDVDEFTREFYQSKRMPLAPAISLPVVEYKQARPATPPPTGFGSELDSLTSCKGSLIPPVPHKDGAKQKLYQGMVLRFCATLQNPSPANKTRSFIIQIFLEDDTIQILEPPSRNSGHKGGVFLSRGELKPLTPADIFVGTTVSIHNFKFEVTDADEYTLHYMEENSAVWAQSEKALIVRKLKQRQEVLQRIILLTPGLAGLDVELDDLIAILAKADLLLVRQEAITLFRELDPRRSGAVKLSKVLKFLLTMDQPPGTS